MIYTEYLTDLIEILRVLLIGTNIPILSKFHKYVKSALKSFNAKSIILIKEIKN